ncbi:hypothetical protein [Paenibacillus sp. FSL H3-0286]|uniref:hypothetical protein n=1 Tax=Paenibacillus sp. FSL H3-0286 TaxID=2921427 RepID=UPI0032521E7E
MKAKFHDIEVEGTPEEVLEFKLRLEQKYQNANYINTHYYTITKPVSVKAEAIIQAMEKLTSKKVSF